MPRSILSSSIITLLTIFHTTTGQICPDGTIERTESEKICDENTISLNNQWYGKGKNGMIRQITYEVESCCTKLQGGDEKIAIKDWKHNSCDQVGAYFIMHTCTDTTTLVRSQFKDAYCKIPIENQNGEQIKQTCGTECLQEKTYEMSYDCSLFDKAPLAPKKSIAPAPTMLKSNGSIKVINPIVLIIAACLQALLLFVSSS